MSQCDYSRLLFEANAVGKTLAMLERRLQEGDRSLLTAEVGDWPDKVQASDEYDSLNAGRAYRLLNVYEFPTEDA